jgi:hypothetical protein
LSEVDKRQYLLDGTREIVDRGEDEERRKRKDELVIGERKDNTKTVFTGSKDDVVTDVPLQ